MLLPLRLYKEQDLKADDYFKTVHTLTYLPAPSVYPAFDQMVLSDRTPTAEEISQNITI
ncbi:hypothetical protein FC15_GL000887 [Lapidilactobacillus concavus DSM 17758]|uniref:Uncharacterized protein n=1 Tax=Lapidilactobacillus concavus DSM 17758 TaxID=1423735 RepID=A0A0R1W7N0_9LACO|nr:hypothetical protein FC15_GL000887 [Lapidilactobacillus concavus DSM 17758]GEL12601.1 hypothetical protein LCO01nite_01500 [Lapidilactobacillus concavus]